MRNGKDLLAHSNVQFLLLFGVGRFCMYLLVLSLPLLGLRVYYSVLVIAMEKAV